MTISPQEEYIIKLLRSLSPYEEVRIVADKEGKPNRFLIIRSQKIMVSEIKIENVA